MDETAALKARVAELESQLTSTKHELQKKKNILRNKYHHNERDDEDDALFQAILDTFGSNSGNQTKSLHTPTSTFAELSFGVSSAGSQHGASGTHARTNTLVKRQKDEKDEQILSELWRKHSVVDVPPIQPQLSTDYSIVDETQSFQPFISYLPQSDNNGNNQTRNYNNNDNNNNNNSNYNGNINSNNNNSNNNFQLNTISETDNDNDNDPNNHNDSNSSNNNHDTGLDFETNKLQHMSLYNPSMISENNENEENRNEAMRETLMKYSNEIEFWKEAYKSLMNSKMDLIESTAKEQNTMRNIIHTMSEQNRHLMKQLTPK